MPVITTNDQTEICAVCRDLMNAENGEIWQLEPPCNHCFHRECMSRLMQSDLDRPFLCPLCRREIGAVDEFGIENDDPVPSANVVAAGSSYGGHYHHGSHHHGSSGHGSSRHGSSRHGSSRHGSSRHSQSHHDRRSRRHNSSRSGHTRRSSRSHRSHRSKSVESSSTECSCESSTDSRWRSILDSKWRSFLHAARECAEQICPCLVSRGINSQYNLDEFIRTLTSVTPQVGSEPTFTDLSRAMERILCNQNGMIVVGGLEFRWMDIDMNHPYLRITSFERDQSSRSFNSHSRYEAPRPSNSRYSYSSHSSHPPGLRRSSTYSRESSASGSSSNSPLSYIYYPAQSSDYGAGGFVREERDEDLYDD